MPTSPPVIRTEQVNQTGKLPSPRFGHTTTLLGQSKAVLFGGAVGSMGEFTVTGDTFIFDLITGTWTQLTETTYLPNLSRAAHAACAISDHHLVVFGGAAGGGPLADDSLYILEESEGEFLPWSRITVSGPTPGGRYGHSLTFVSPLMVVFGGINAVSTMSDVWTMDVQHRPYAWQKVEVQSMGPCPRVYHSAALCSQGPASEMLVIFGGRLEDKRPLSDTWGLRQHRTGSWDWVEGPAVGQNLSPARYQHTAAFIGPVMFIIGGRGSESGLPAAFYDTESCEWCLASRVNAFRHADFIYQDRLYIFGGFIGDSLTNPTRLMFSIDLSPNQILPPPPLEAARPVQVRVAKQVLIAHEGDLCARRLPLEELTEEREKIRSELKLAVETVPDLKSFADLVIEELLRPAAFTGFTSTADHQYSSSSSAFFLSAQKCIRLCEAIKPILQNSPNLLELRPPIKVYGDLHGQYFDLMRHFAMYKAPHLSEHFANGGQGDLASTDYLFLGDYVDRGSFSLEVICLLFALKIKHPYQIHLLRGNHEDPEVNSLYGFSMECKTRLNEDPDHKDSAFRKFNEVFEWLPLAATIDQKILCLHGGIGGSINYLSDIHNINRPIVVSHQPSTSDEQKVTDILWSDPTDNDDILGVQHNSSRDLWGTGKIKKFGPDRVDEFLNQNPPLDLIIRAHECVMDGFERFSGGRLMTVFSATNYCKKTMNKGAVLYIQRDLLVLPQLIVPVCTPPSWDDTTLERPPTPPRRSYFQS